MQKRRLLGVCSLLMLSACGSAEQADAVARSKVAFGELSKADLADITAQLPPDQRTPQTLDALRQMVKAIPPGTASISPIYHTKYRVYSDETIVVVIQRYSFPRNKTVEFDAKFRYPHGFANSGDSSRSNPELIAAQVIPVS